MTEVGSTRSPVIDCDVHAVVPHVKALFPYLSSFWRDTITQTGFAGPADTYYPANMPTTARPGSMPPNNEPAGSSLAWLREQALDPDQVELAIVNCVSGVDGTPNPDAGAALARATNDWLVEHWLEPEPRLRASIVTASQHLQPTIDEIHRLGDDPRFVQVLLPVKSAQPYGNRNFWPVFEAALVHDLPIALHFGGATGLPPTPVGWPSFSLEEYVSMASIMQAQLLSLVAEGVFEQFPDLRVVCLEGGFTWLPALFWRFDKEWKGLRREAPWVKRPPSEYINAHCHFSIQPLDLPSEPRQRRDVIDQLGGADRLLYASDYPHWHDFSPDELYRVLNAAEIAGIQRDNAKRLYRWP